MFVNYAVVDNEIPRVQYYEVRFFPKIVHSNLVFKTFM
jgi:hypothetical protein